MAIELNKSRMLQSRLALIATLIVVLLSRQYWTEESAFHEIFEVTGVFLVSLCAMGRVYSTAFLGGFKNDRLITYGSYSFMRNPLYFFSLMGITGVALISNHMSVMIGLPLFFYFLYSALIKREEGFLEETFGQPFEDYKKKVPALWPKFGGIEQPEVVQASPRHLNMAFMDAIWWLSALPIIETVEHLQDSGILPTFFTS